MGNKKYDVFISFKNSDNGIDTEDKAIAFKVYQYLESNNLKVFYSPETLKNLGKGNWANEIQKSITESKVFIALSTRKSYMLSEWCQKERTSFLALEFAERNKLKPDPRMLYSYIAKPMTLSDLPDEIKNFECFEHEKENVLTELLTYISNHLYQLDNSDYKEPSIMTEEMKEEKKFQKRKKEIENYVDLDDLNTATLRLMDFISDFTDKIERKNEAKDIRETFNLLKKENKENYNSKDIKIRFTLLRNQILNLIGTVELELKEINSIENRSIFSLGKIKITKNIPFLNAKKRFKNELKNIVFQSHQMSKNYNKKKSTDKFILKPIDLTLKYGEITVLVGENASGKTTLLNMVAGELLQSSGEIEYPELANNKKKNYYHIKTQISYVSQELKKWNGSLVNNLHYTLSMNGIKGKDNIAEVDFILHRLGLEEYKDLTWNEISGGFKMRFALARAILRQPKLLILDEPLAHLDINTTKVFLNDIRNIVNSSKYRMSAIISSQHIYELEDIADKIIFLRTGDILYNGSINKFGDKRKTNTYEVNVDIPLKELTNILNFKGDLSVEITGKNYIINLPLGVTDEMLMNIFWENNLSVKYFRNISTSTRKLFMESLDE